MCLIAWRTAPAAPWPLLLAANRDEFHAREALPLHRWTSLPRVIIAGQDLLGGGTWLGLAVTARGLRIAMLTNVRDGRATAVAADAPSRGLLVTGLLTAEEAASEAMARLARADDLPRMAGFNLVAIDLIATSAPWPAPALPEKEVPPPDSSAAGRAVASPPCSIVTSYLAHPGSGGPGPRRIGDGVHGLSNGALDAPWPKTRALMAAVARAGALRDAAAIAGQAGADRLLLECLADRRPAPVGELPDTGIDPAREQWLSSPFIPGEQYGTRCSTLIAISAAGHFEVFERRYDREGRPIGDTRLAG